MNIQELFKQYPKVAESIKDWYYNKWGGWDNTEVPQEFIEMMKGKIEKIMYSSIDTNPRILFDFFDENNIYIGVFPKFFTENDSLNFICTIWKYNEDKVFSNRKSAEEWGITEAIILLNNKIG